MNGPIRVLLSRAPALIPGMLDAFSRAARPLILVPESFTLTAEQAISKASPARGFIGRQVFSATSLKDRGTVLLSYRKISVEMSPRRTSIRQRGTRAHREGEAPRTAHGMNRPRVLTVPMS